MALVRAWNAAGQPTCGAAQRNQQAAAAM